MYQHVIYQSDFNDKWYFWDETWAGDIGPFDTEEQAQKELMKYWKELTKNEDNKTCAK